MKLSVFLALIASLAWAQPDPSLVEKLRQGGYVLYLRHTSTDFTQNDARMKSYADCASQRNLTDKGRDEARTISEHVKRLGIPIGAVHASPFCRTMETARLAFGSVEATNDVRGGPVRSDDPARYDPLRKLLGTRPPAGQNAAISSHGNPFYAIYGPPYLAEGEIAVVDPATSRIIGRIRVEEWAALKP
jgi:hypothetical protein